MTEQIMTQPSNHAHRCLRCDNEFTCQTPGVCIAQYDVLPRVVAIGAGGRPYVRDHCYQNETGAWVPAMEFPVPVALPHPEPAA